MAITYFLTSWPSHSTFDLAKLQASLHYKTTYVNQIWWRLIKQCDLYRGQNKQTDKQAVKRTYLPNFFEILANNLRVTNITITYDTLESL